MPTSCTPETTRLGQEPAHLAWAEEPDIFSIMKLILALLLTAGIPLAAADLDPQSVAGVWQTDQAGGIHVFAIQPDRATMAILHTPAPGMLVEDREVGSVSFDRDSLVFRVLAPDGSELRTRRYQVRAVSADAIDLIWDNPPLGVRLVRVAKSVSAQ